MEHGTGPKDPFTGVEDQNDVTNYSDDGERNYSDDARKNISVTK